MICIFSDSHNNHRPPFEVFNGDHDVAQEVPERAVTILNAIKSDGHKCMDLSSKVPRKILEIVHSAEYINHLEEVSNSIDENGYIYPSVHDYTTHFNVNSSKLSQVARRGRFCFDTYTPILKHTYEVALDSASLAHEASQHLLLDPIEPIYALCRPPGHHAEHAMSGGYCYFNNAAVAAQNLSMHGKVAVLDVDFHHGNGTQNIFYEREDVLTVSIHADPKVKFPFFSGFADETGTGAGLGANFNIPLPLGIGNSEYSLALGTALKKINKFNPKYLVIAFGADTHVADPIGGMKLTTEYYQNMSKLISGLNLPTMIVQEGGYNTSLLGDVVNSFLKGF